ncbi:MAG: tRNA pseudouridine(55) synthase TruB [Verrucomicrobiia bacterium]
MPPPVQPQLDGLLLIDKPTGHTSHDMVDFVRKRFGQKKVGHCGTLDPMATGLLMLLFGKATRIQDLLMAEDKEYVGTFKLGQTTDSQDADGQVLETREVPPLSHQEIETAMAKFRGDFYQTPPMVSAVKKGGVPLYKLARQGKEIVREPRLVHVYHSEVLRIDLPLVRFRIACTKGFYVRTYAHDLGQTLGCGAHLVQLTRTKSGNFSLEKAVTWPQLQEAQDESFLHQNLISLPEISRIRRV